MWSPPGGFLPMGNQPDAKLIEELAGFKNSPKHIIGFSIYPTQYSLICKELQGYGHKNKKLWNREKNENVAFVGGNCSEHLVSMNYCRVNISLIFMQFASGFFHSYMVYGNAKDVCKLKSDVVIVEKSFNTIIHLFTLFAKAFSMKCTIM